MDAPRFRQVERLFHEALELPSYEREGFVTRECAGDAEIKASVLSLLATVSADDDRLRRVIEDEAVTWASDNFTQLERAGPYRMVRELGQGGMGTVFLAERDDQAYESQVAVKVIRDRLAGGEVTRRFINERQILAQLNHQGIARLLDGGSSEDGVPYIVMEYVDGSPIDVYADGHRLDIRARLDLMKKVCDAVQYAHRNLIVHRDLKPGNILVTEDGTPKLLDFGVAKLMSHDSANQTTMGLRPMTPAYASPEQMRGDPVTTSTDVYALGLILYELLSGHAPQRMEGTSAMERARVVCEVDPPPPSEIVALHTRLSGDPEKGELSHPETIGEARGTEPNRLKHLLAGDLDAIVMKALMKDPQERYASVEMMSQDIGRYLGRLPVTARPMTPLYWASRLVARRPAEVFAGSVVTILIASMAAFYTSRLQGERDVAALEAEKAEQVASFLSGIFEVGDVRAASGAGLTVTARELLDNGARRIQRELADQPDVRSSLMVTIADAYESLGLHTEAGALLDSTYAIRREFYGPDHAEVGSALNELGNSLWDRGSYDSAQALQERALAVRLAALPSGHPDIAESYNDLGKVLQEKAEYDSAGALFQTAVELYRAQPGDARANIAALLLNQAQIADIRTDVEASVAFNQEAVEISRTLETESLPNDLSTALHNLAISLEARDEGDDQRAAEQLLRESIEVVERRLGPNQPINGVTLISLGRLAESRGATGEAEALYREGLELEVKYYGGAHPNIAYDLTTLANLIRKTGHPDEARGHYERAIEIARATLEPTSPFLARPLAAYGDLLSELGELVPADETLSEAFPIAVDAVGGDHPFTLTIKASLGSLRGRQERFAEGERLLMEAWAPFVASADGDDPRVRSLSLRFVEFYEAWDRPEEADRYRSPD